uniref:Poly(Aspartic acid) hydrolase-1 n=1 Tax=Sphingomonas sp. KT-1 TaxID=88363 RepID=Q7WSC1_9SPHN|nr:poly(aspartic acid) hydrolase-1 [Sphingomonas sp. KT-1]
MRPQKAAARALGLAVLVLAMTGGALGSPVTAGAAAAPAAASKGKAAALPDLKPGAGSFLFTGWAGKPLKVHYYAPDKITETTRILFVIHGAGRNADGYRDAWIPYAKEGQYIVLTPEYSMADFPTSLTYNVGHIVDEAGNPRPREEWSFASIEPMFDQVRKATGSKVPTYAIYGHSAGGQFVHRFVELWPDARYSRAVAANAGWYTMPDLAIKYPYGLKDAPTDAAGLKATLEKPLTILLGTADTDVNHHQLSRTPEAMTQGVHRLARGEFFYAYGRKVAHELNAKFAWKLDYAPDIAHSNTGMSQYAQKLVWE